MLPIWVLLLLELAPYLIKIIAAIFKAIQDVKDRDQRKFLRREAVALARTQVKALRKAKVQTMSADTQEFALEAQWQEFQTKIA